MTVRVFSSTFSEGEVYSFGNQSRGRLGRPEEDPTEPGKVPFMGEDPFVVVSLSCSHGNTLLATRRMKLLTPVFKHFLNKFIFSKLTKLNRKIQIKVVMVTFVAYSYAATKWREHLTMTRILR